MESNHSSSRDIKNVLKRRKNYLPTLIATIVLWLLAAGLVYFIDPAVFGALPTFFILVFLSLLFTFSTIFESTRRGLIISSAVIIFLLLRYLGIGNILNLLLLSGLSLSVEIYFLKKSS